MTARLRAAGIPSARLDARLLVAEALGISTTAVFSHPERPVTVAEAARLEALASRRERREPMSHILGQREFWSLPFCVGPAVLDPRPDSETLIAAVLEALPDRQRPWRLLDFGTGSGCLLLALLSELPAASGLGIDASPAALAVAAGNAQALGLAGRTAFRLGDWGTGLDGAYDIIVSNPPYIPDGEIAGLEPEVALFEPRSALAGGLDGLDCYRALAGDLWRLLAPGGVAAVEVGAGQAMDVRSLLLGAAELAGSPPPESAVLADFGGIDRCIRLIRHP